MEISTIWTFALHTKVTFRYSFKGARNLFSSLANYQLIILAGLAVNLILIFAFTSFFDVFYIVSELAAIIITFAVRYVLNVRFVWTTGHPS